MFQHDFNNATTIQLLPAYCITNSAFS